MKGANMFYHVIYRMGTPDSFEWKIATEAAPNEAAANEIRSRIESQGMVCAMVIEASALQRAGLPTTYDAHWVNSEWVSSNNDNELGYKLAMVIMTGHDVQTASQNDYPSTALLFILADIKKHLCPNMNIDATADRIVAEVKKADSIWAAFFERRRTEQS